MNNKKVIRNVIIITVISVLLIGIIFGVWQFKKLNNKTPISENEFKNIMENLSYKVENITDEFREFEEIKTYLSANKEDNYTIDFIIFNEEEYAKTYYFNAKAYFDSNKGNNYTTSYMSLSNYSKYTLNSNNKYTAILRVKNTVISLDAESKYKKEIKKAIKELNY